MPRQYGLSPADWKVIADLSTSFRRTGRPRTDDRLQLNSASWLLCSVRA